MTLKRDLVKYVRDKAKSKYNKGTECYICGSQDNLDFHHFYGLTELLEVWLKKNKITITSEDEILGVREQFIEEEHEKLYDHAVTLCHSHHLRLHGIYGKRPTLITANKQQHWVEIQRNKHGMV
jgi:hypothetical protein|tara:strand:+ start:875 stop:1246 length:372 start_codon:yes stop_codon:yes gene_type:complete